MIGFVLMMDGKRDFLPTKNKIKYTITNLCLNKNFFSRFHEKKKKISINKHRYFKPIQKTYSIYYKIDSPIFLLNGFFLFQKFSTNKIQKFKNFNVFIIKDLPANKFFFELNAYFCEKMSFSYFQIIFLNHRIKYNSRNFLSFLINENLCKLKTEIFEKYRIKPIKKKKNFSYYKGFFFSFMPSHQININIIESLSEDLKFFSDEKEGQCILLEKNEKKIFISKKKYFRSPRILLFGRNTVKYKRWNSKSSISFIFNLDKNDNDNKRLKNKNHKKVYFFDFYILPLNKANRGKNLTFSKPLYLSTKSNNVLPKCKEILFIFEENVLKYEFLFKFFNKNNIELKIFKIPYTFGNFQVFEIFKKIFWQNNSKKYKSIFFGCSERRKIFLLSITIGLIPEIQSSKIIGGIKKGIFFKLDKILIVINQTTYCLIIN